MTKQSSAVRVATLVTLAAAVAFAPAAARANTDARANTQSKLIQPVQPLTVADNVVVTPGTQTSPPAAAPAPTVVVPQSSPQAAPVAAPAPTHTTNTQVVEHERSYVGTIFVSALLGGAAGALIGGALWYLNDNQEHTARIGYWAAGGVLVGTGVGVMQLVVQEGRHERAVASLPTDPAPTFRLALFKREF